MSSKRGFELLGLKSRCLKRVVMLVVCKMGGATLSCAGFVASAFVCAVRPGPKFSLRLPRHMRAPSLSSILTRSLI